MKHTDVSSIPAPPLVRAAVERFIREARAASGDRLGQVVLFGSIARGESRPDSDVDLLVVWRGRVFDALETLMPISTRILIETGVDISPHPVSPDRFAGLPAGRMYFDEAVEREGLLVEG